MRIGPGLLLLIATGGWVTWCATAGDERPTLVAPRPSATAEHAGTPRPLLESADCEPLVNLSPHRTLEADFHVCGTASCAASNCHGGDRSGNNRPFISVDGHRHRRDRNRDGNTTWGGEYSVWLHRDPHARAYEVLFDPRSVEMARKLDLGDAHRANRCLNCHAVNVQPHPDPRAHANQPSLADGVGCEACHGPAGEWLDRHKQSDWALLSPAEKESLGFWNLDDILTRTRTCVACHVGGPGRDVDHDLIAAGHPRLNFEMSAYQALLPHHWSEQANLNVAHPAARDLGEFEAKSWAVGQVVAAEAAVDQTSRRARNPHAVWPEFSETGCFACHHDLSVEVPLTAGADADFISWRQARGFGTRRAGSYPWGTWSMPLLTTMEDDAEFRELLAEVRDLMGQPMPTRNRVALQTANLRQKLKHWATRLDEADFGPAARDAHLVALARDARWLAHEDWDAATQTWLALAALERADALVDRSNPELRSALVRIRDHLEFPRPPRRFSSPRDFGESLELLRIDFERLPTLVGSEADPAPGETPDTPPRTTP